MKLFAYALIIVLVLANSANFSFSAAENESINVKGKNYVIDKDIDKHDKYGLTFYLQNPEYTGHPIRFELDTEPGSNWTLNPVLTGQ
jgi:hypothetical protein